MNAQGGVDPKYELKSTTGRLMEAGMIVVLILVGGVLAWGLISKGFPPEYGILATIFLVTIPVALHSVRSSYSESKKDLILFTDLISDQIKSWASVGPSVHALGYEAYCELVDDYYLQLVPNFLSFSQYRPSMIYLYKFITNPEPVAKAPLFKFKLDKKTLNPTEFPQKNMDLKWKYSEERWKQLVSEDEVIRMWMSTYYTWRLRGFGHRQLKPTDVRGIKIFCSDNNLVHPSIKGLRLKGKVLTMCFTFVPPLVTDLSELSDYYVQMIDVGKRILQYIQDGLVPQIENK